MNEIYCGDIRDIAKMLPAQSVNCIVTSPPYFGLRDYQTAEWEGGEADCDHAKDRSNGINSSTLGGGKSTTNHQQEVSFRDTCSKCGAKRIDKQIGLEETPEAYVNTLVGIFWELKRVLRDDGTIWLNLGDSYGTETRAQRSNGSRGISHATQQAQDTMPRLGGMPKQLLGIPWRVAFALQADGWYLRSDIIWHKKNPMPESVTDRPTKAHEYIFLLSKKPRYYYGNEAVRESSSGNSHGGGVAHNGRYTVQSGRNDSNLALGIITKTRNHRTVWTVSTKPYKAAHFAVFPPDLIRPCILAGCPSGGIVLDPFMGSGTVAQVAIETGRNWLGVELNPEYIELANKRIAQTQPALPIEITL